MRSPVLKVKVYIVLILVFIFQNDQLEEGSTLKSAFNGYMSKHKPKKGIDVTSHEKYKAMLEEFRNQDEDIGNGFMESSFRFTISFIFVLKSIFLYVPLERLFIQET